MPQRDPPPPPARADAARPHDAIDLPAPAESAFAEPPPRATAPPAAPRPAPGRPRDLFLAFNRMALQGFGGVLAVAQFELVERLRWLSREEYVELLSLAQVLPGPNVCNLSLMVGDRYFGLRGAFAALAGMMALPLVIVLMLAALYGRWAHLPAVAGALRGMGAVAAGLVIASAIRLAPVLRSSPLGRPLAALVCLLTFCGVALLRVPLVWIVAVLGGLSVAAAWWRLR